MNKNFQEYETMKNEYNQLEMDNNELHEKYEKLMENFKCMKDENKKLNDMNMFLSTKLNKFEMQKELLSKDIAKNIDNLSLILSSKKVSNINFSDTVRFF